MRDELLWLWMQRLLGQGTRRAGEALARCGSPRGLLALSPKERGQAPYLLTPREREAVGHPDFSAAEAVWEETARMGCQVLTPDSPGYPDLLRDIHSPPLALFAQGDLSLLRGRYRVAMVGTRDPDEYGLKAARKLSGEIARLGGAVVSGLAVGIDAACHRGALEAGGATVAVVAGGLDLDYPKPNRALRALIGRHGLVLSEYPPGTPALPGHFPVRNRVISGLSLATVLVQGRRRSGGMLTAAHALSQNRDVWALPGDIFSARMEGCHALLAEGAAPALSGRDILAPYPPVYGFPLREDPPPEPPPLENRARLCAVPDYLDSRQSALLDCLLEGPLSPDDLCLRAGLSSGEALGLLTQLELFGLIEARPGPTFAAAGRRRGG